MTTLFILFQHIVPQHLLSRLVGLAAGSRLIRVPLIRWFIRRYRVDMSEAAVQEPKAFANFNEFFTRELAPGARPLAEEADAVLCPADGCISQLGTIDNDMILQAKGRHFSLSALLGVKEVGAGSQSGKATATARQGSKAAATNSQNANATATGSQGNEAAGGDLQGNEATAPAPQNGEAAASDLQGHNMATSYRNGSFATVYLAPRDYHRVHIPLAGRLLRTRYIPGRLFSVNQATAEGVANLFARNERLVCEFSTAAGPMALIMVGAMIVASIETAWAGRMQEGRMQEGKVQTRRFQADDYEHRLPTLTFTRGAEVGRFLLGSTVIVLFPPGRIALNPELTAGSPVRMGQTLARLI